MGRQSSYNHRLRRRHQRRLRDDNNKNNKKNNNENNKNKNNNEDTSTTAVTTAEDDDTDDGETHHPTNHARIIHDERVQAYVDAFESCGKVNQYNNIRDTERLLGGLADRQVRFADILTPERVAASWMRLPESIKSQLDKDEFMEMKSVQDWKSATKNLEIDGFGKMGEHMVRGAFEFLFGDYITYLEVVGAMDWIGVKMVLEFDGVRYEFLIEVKTSRLTHRNSLPVRKQFKKETDIARDDSGEPVVYGSAVVYDALNLTRI